MAYIDKTFFATFSLTSIPDASFSVLAERASDLIDILTMDKITAAGGLVGFSAAAQVRIKKATAAQLDTLYALGGNTVLADPGGAVMESESLGKYNYHRSQNEELETVSGVPLSPLVRGYLRPTGLLYRGILPQPTGLNENWEINNSPIE